MLPGVKVGVFSQRLALGDVTSGSENGCGLRTCSRQGK